MLENMLAKEHNLGNQLKSSFNEKKLEDFEAERDGLDALLVDTMTHFDIYQRLELKKQKTNDLTKEEEELFEEAQPWTRKRTPLVNITQQSLPLFLLL